MHTFFSGTTIDNELHYLRSWKAKSCKSCFRLFYCICPTNAQYIL